LDNVQLNPGVHFGILLTCVQYNNYAKTYQQKVQMYNYND